MSNSYQWFRVHNDILDDDKLIMLDPADCWYFTCVLALKNLGVLDNEQDDKRRDRKVSLRLRLSLDETIEVKARLVAEGLIDGNWQPVAWKNRQFLSDSSTERSRKHRAKKKQEQAALGDQIQEEASATPCNVTATLQQRCSNAPR